jgi:hypothetical protein
VRAQRLLESALGAQRVSLHMRFVQGDAGGRVPRGAAPGRALAGLHVEIFAVRGDKVAATPRDKDNQRVVMQVHWCPAPGGAFLCAVARWCAAAVRGFVS